MRPAFAVRIEDPISIYDFMTLILEKREIIVAGELCLKFADELPAILVAVDAHRQNFSVFFPEKVFQLAELLRTIRSPVAAIKNQDDVFFAAVTRQCDVFAVLVFQGEIRRGFADLDSLQVRGRKIRAVLGTKLRERCRRW